MHPPSNPTHRVIVEVLGRLCGMAAAPALPERWIDAPLDKEAIVDFSGDYVGQISLGVYGDLSRALAAGMMDAETVSDERTENCLMEILNIIAGNLLPQIFGHGKSIYLGSPRLNGSPVRFKGLVIASAKTPFEEGWCEVEMSCPVPEGKPA